MSGFSPSKLGGIIKMAATSMHLLYVSYALFTIICSLSAIDSQVPDGFVYTDLHRTARKGDQLVLKCQFYGTPVAVYWKKGDDPTKSPNLIYRVEGEPSSGFCVADQSCSMGDDYSLIINSIKVADQGTYICRVSNYKGVLIHNFTEVAVYAPPMEPFPVIRGCPVMLPNDTEKTCSISTSDSISITCSASGYFPDIDLFFLHGSQNIDINDTNEVTNLEGTKNKSISILAEPSETSYVCFASDIPGLQEQRTVSIVVNSIEDTETIQGHTTKTPTGGVGRVHKVIPAVSVVFVAVVGGCVAAIFVCHRRKRQMNQGTGDPEANPLCPDIDGKVSFFELWYLVSNMSDTELETLRKVLVDLSIPEVDEVLTAERGYYLLSFWKDTHKYDNEGIRLRNALSPYGLSDSWNDMCARRQDAETTVSDDLLDHILREIGDERGISLFLQALITKKTKMLPTLTGKREDIIKVAREELLQWRETARIGNHVIKLSLALERAKCRPVDRTFFKVPPHLLKDISEREVEGFACRLTSRHCERLAKAVGITTKIFAIVDENNEDLFDTRSMISDWINGQECSNFRKRCIIDDAIVKIGRHDITGSFVTSQHQLKEGDILERQHPEAQYFTFSRIFDDDLRMLLKHLPSDAKQLFMEKIGMSVEEGGDDDLEEMLREWRDKNLRKSSLQDLVAIHTEVLNMKNGSNVLDVNDDELEKLMESITSPKQVEKLTSLLGINNTEAKSPLQHLKEWRDSQKTEKPRKTLREALHTMNLSGCLVDPLSPKYMYETEMVRIALTMLATDVEPLATLLKMDTNKVKTVKEPEKGTVGLLMRLFKKTQSLDTGRRRQFSIALREIGYLDVARSAYFGYGAPLCELCNITSRLSEKEMQKLICLLELDGTVQSGGKEVRSPCNRLELMKTWKNQLKQEPVHFRFKLAMGIRAIKKVELAEDVLAGRFRPREISSDVVESICSSLDNTQLEKLCEHLEPNKKKAEDRQTTTALVADWVNSWLGRFEEFTLNQLIKDKLGSQVQENDGVFKAGFFELAEEIMLLGVSRLISVKPVNQEFDEISNKGEVEANPESTESVETPSGE